MDKEKKTIFGFVILTIFLVILAIFAISTMQKMQKDKMTSKTLGMYTMISEEADIDMPNQSKEEVLKKVTNNYEYVCVKKCIDKYHEAIKKALEDKLENISEIYGLLDEQYIEFKEITKINIKEQILYDKFLFVIDEINKKEELDTNIEYLVTGSLINETTKEVTDYQYLIRMDFANNVYSVILDDFIKSKNVSSEEFVIENKKIENNPYNHFTIENINDNKIAIILYRDFKTRVLYSIDSACKKINQEYYQKRFDNQEELEDYLKKNEEAFSLSEIFSYKVKEYNNNKIYFISDNDNNIYVFEVPDLTNYTIMLDDYTTDIDEKIQAKQNNDYRLNSDKEKINRYINRMEQALKEKNYNYLYNNLNEEFKNNNYKSKEKLQKYLEDNLYSETDLILKNYNNLVKENDVYVVEAYVKDKMETIDIENIITNEEEDSESMVMIFMLHFNEDGSFEYSFSLKK